MCKSVLRSSDLFLLLLLCFAAEPEHELFLVYGKGRPGVIRGMDMNAKVPDEYMIPIENLMNPRALDFHAESEFIYFADATSYIIGRQKIDGTERDTILKEGRLAAANFREKRFRSVCAEIYSSELLRWCLKMFRRKGCGICPLIVSQNI